MTHAGDRPRLANKAKLRRDPRSGQQVLLSPEKGLVLNRSGASILALCNGERSSSEIVAELERQYGAERAALEPDVLRFLNQLCERGLLEGWP